MSYHDDPDTPPRRRRSLMEERMRVAQGEEPDDDTDDFFDDDDSEVYPARRPAADNEPRRYVPPAGGGGGSPFGMPMPVSSSNSGCSPGLVYLGLGLIAGLVLIAFFLNNAVTTVFQPQTPGGLFGGFLASPTPNIQASNATVLLEVQQLQRLETTSYTIEKVIEAEIGGSNLVDDFLFGQKLLLIARGRVEAGVDLSQLSAEDVSISPDGSTLTVQMPPVEIFSTTLDNNATRVYSRTQGWLTVPDPDLETRARQEGEAAILQTACEDGILQRTSDDSRQTLEQFLSLLPYENVQVVAAPLPTECAVSAP